MRRGAFAPLLQAKPKHANKVLYARSEDTSWHRPKWTPKLKAALTALGSKVERALMHNAHREINIAEGVRVRLFAGSGDGAYTLVSAHIRYHGARLLFTGAAHCEY